MEIFMTKVNYQYNDTATKSHLADALHSTDFLPDRTAAKFNFHVYLIKHKIKGFGHRGYGCLTLPTAELGSQFLALYGGPDPPKSISLGNMRVVFRESNKLPRDDVLETIRGTPYRDPVVVEQEEQRSKALLSEQIPIQTIQFGWHCRDDVVSIESEYTPQEPGVLFFDEDRRQFRITFKIPDKDQPTRSQEHTVAMRIPSIDSITSHHYLQRDPALVLFLNDPPAYEAHPKSSTTLEDQLSILFASLFGGNPGDRQQSSFLPIPDHKRVAPFASLVIRVVFPQANHLDRFDHLRKLANVKRFESYECRVERRGLFSEEAMKEFEKWTRNLDWAVAYQVESILRIRAIDAKEMLDILPSIAKLASPVDRGGKGKDYTAAFLKGFKAKVKALYQSNIDEDTSGDAVRQCYEETLAEFDKGSLDSLSLQPTDDSLYQSLHVIITPTAIYLDGPFPERSNRVIRQFDTCHHESFLRVTFADEGSLQYRATDRELNHKEFIRKRFGGPLLNGLSIAGRDFKFLAYSQSALKEHSVWFVKDFVQGTNSVTAETIIQNLGTFDELPSDSRLMYTPARYAARISQAFTATDACRVEVAEIRRIQDIEVISSNGQKYCFTDGVGTFSPDLAKDVWKQLKRNKRGGGERSLENGYPEAQQVRIGGSKGMLSVDLNLEGHVICLRDSMVKFDAPSLNSIEIARSFDKPTPYFLNRPLIMLMEGLGVPYKTFEHFQDLAVEETYRGLESLEGAAKMLDAYGLGSSFRMSSVLHHLHKLEITELNDDVFYQKAMTYTINHILRELKNHARIPVPGAWTLVGVADIHMVLEPGEIYAFVKPPNEDGIYLEGPVLISRSPTIHPGDIQLARAVGRPPPGSLYDRQPLANTVVFSCKGDRPLPSCLGGGDLDGDVYNLIPLSNPSLAGFRLEANAFYAPSEYAAATRKVLDRKSTMADVAEFVMEYILSDVLGMIATNWRLIADKSPQGIYDPDCITLANLHSDAVDYPKSGNPVAISRIPRPRDKIRPDWHAPETIGTKGLKEKYYESDKAIGRLFRAIELPVTGTKDGTRVQTHSFRRRNLASGNETVLGMDPYFTKIKERVEQFVGTDSDPGMKSEAEAIYARYTSELEAICYLCTISSSRNAPLTEEEVLVGTIVQKTSQPRQRADKMAKMREATRVLVGGVREMLEGGSSDNTTDGGEEEYLRRAWVAWLVSLERAGEFGGCSFGWAALGAVFDAMRQIEERGERERLRLSRV